MGTWATLRRMLSAKDSKKPIGHAVQESREPVIPNNQTALLLYGPRQQYQTERDYPIPELKDDGEVLVKNLVLGLNPLDWKAPYVPGTHHSIQG